MGQNKLFRMAAAVACAGAALVGGAGVAQASPLLFTVTGVLNGSFVADSDPTIVLPVGNFGFVAQYTSGTGDFSAHNIFGGLIPANPSFPNVGFAVLDNSSLEFDYYTDQIFTGPVTAPHFVAGTYSLNGYQNNGVPTPGPAGTLVISGGPGAPAPQLGGGLFAGLAVALALFVTRQGWARKPA